MEEGGPECWHTDRLEGYLENDFGLFGFGFFCDPTTIEKFEMFNMTRIFRKNLKVNVVEFGKSHQVD
jgi:hypothetical protein